MKAPLAASPTTLPWAARSTSLLGSVIDSSTSLLQKQAHDIVRFAMGSPATEAVPTAILAELAQTAMRDDGAGTFDYAATEGDPSLLSALLTHLASTAEATSADRLLITTGGMQGLDLAAKLFLDPEDIVVVEAPTYTNGVATMLSYGAQVLEVPVDQDGMVVEALPGLVEAAGRLPTAIYVIPSFQNPSGATLSVERRELLLRLARSWRAVVIDDDPYAQLRFSGSETPSLRALAAGDPLVVSIRTFSKILAPGLRVGYVDADAEVVQKMISAKQAMDTCTNLPAQRLVAEFLRGGYLVSHLGALRGQYRERKRAMQEALAEHLTGSGTWTDPDGGFFLWLTLQPDIDTSVLFDVALREGVAFIPGRAFSASGQFGNALRLCFASTEPERIHEGIRRLAKAIAAVT